MAQSALMEQINNMSHGRALLVGLFMLGVYYSTAYNDGSSIEAQLAQVEQEVTQEEAKKADTDKTLKLEQEAKAEVVTLGEKFKIASEKLPSELKSQTMIDTIYSAARAAGCEVISARPLATEKKKYHLELPVAIEARGTFGQLNLFNYYISTLERITRVRNYTVEASDEKGVGPLRFAGEVVAFLYKAEKGGQ